jgi:excisionase family DNA binding protein
MVRMTSNEANDANQPRNKPERRQPQRMGLPAAAEYVGISERHLRRMVQERKIDHYRVGGRLVFDVRDLEELLARCRREAIR